MGKRIDVPGISPVIGTLYPPPFDLPCRTRERKKLGDAAGLTQFGVNLLRLPPGAWSSQRHWHPISDEFVYVLAGEVVLVTDDCEEILRSGDAAGFKSGETNGHCLQNHSDSDVLVLEIGTRVMDEAAPYSDIDMVAHAIIIYSRNRRIDLMMGKWENHLRKQRPALTTKPCGSNELAFLSTHIHERTGRTFLVRHVPISLYSNPQDHKKKV